MEILKPVLVLGVLGLLFGVLLSIASKVFAVEMNPVVGNILGVLPGANCGACADFRDAKDLQTQLLKEKLRQMHVLSEEMPLHKKLLQFWALKPEKLQDKLPL